MIRYRGTYPANDQSILLTNLNISPMPEIVYTAAKIPQMAGLLPIDKTHNARTINATFQLNGRTPDENEALSVQLARWAESAYEEQLTLDERPGFYYLATLTGATEADLAEMWPEVTLTFTCPYPYALSSAIKDMAIGNPFTYAGDIRAWPTITFLATQAKTGAQWSNGKGIITLDYTILAGHTVIIDNAKHLITDNGESVLQHLSLLSDWLYLDPGGNTVTGPGGLVQWREVCL